MDNIDNEIEKIRKEMQSDIDSILKATGGTIKNEYVFTERHLRLLILLSKKADMQTEKVIGLTNSLVLFTKGLLFFTVILVFFGIAPFARDFKQIIAGNHNFNPAINKESQGWEQKDAVTDMRQRKDSTVREKPRPNDGKDKIQGQK
jgi:hypothetical protein